MECGRGKAKRGDASNKWGKKGGDGTVGDPWPSLGRVTVLVDLALIGTCPHCGAETRRMLARSQNRDPVAGIDELMRSRFLDTRQNLRMMLRCQSCGKEFAGAWSEILLDGRVADRARVEAPPDPPMLLWSRSGNVGKWSTQDAELLMKDTSADTPEEAAREALDRLRDVIAVTSVDIEAVGGRIEARHDHPDGAAVLRLARTTEPNTLEDEFGELELVMDRFNAFIVGLSNLLGVPPRTSAEALERHARESPFMPSEVNGEPPPSELFETDPLAWARWCPSGREMAVAAGVLFAHLWMAFDLDERAAEVVRRASGIAREAYLDGLDRRDPQRVSEAVTLASAVGLVALKRATMAGDRIGAVAAEGFFGVDAEGDRNAWEYQRDLGMLTDLFTIRGGGLLTVAGAVYVPSLEEYSGEIAKNVSTAGLRIPAEPASLRYEDHEVRVLPTAKPGTCAFVVLRKSEFTLLALEEGRWVMGDGWSRKMAAGALRDLGGGRYSRPMR